MCSAECGCVHWSKMWLPSLPFIMSMYELITHYEVYTDNICQLLQFGWGSNENAQENSVFIRSALCMSNNGLWYTALIETDITQPTRCDSGCLAMCVLERVCMLMSCHAAVCVCECVQNANVVLVCWVLSHRFDSALHYVIIQPRLCDYLWSLLLKSTVGLGLMMHITDNSSALLHQLECFLMTSDRGSNNR